MNMPHQLLEANLKEIRSLCLALGVIRLDAFGSILRDDFDAESDIDFLVSFERGESVNAFEQYFDFKEKLEALLERRVDLVCANAVRNPYFLKELEESRLPLYAA